MTTADFDYVRHYVQDQCAIVLEPGKEYLVESRLQNLARKERIDSLENLFCQLREGPGNGLHRKIVEAMTTNETSFFRDIHPFEALRDVVLPQLINRRGAERQMHFWCGAASTGQEPFSVLMLIAEHFPQLLGWDFKFIATDLSTEVLARASSGLFTQIEVNRGLPASFLVKHFTPRGAAWEFREDLRRRVQFRQLNLAGDWSGLPKLDLVFLRNVLIYFDLPTKKRILAQVRHLLRPGGYLVLGSTETTFNVDESYERVVANKTTVYRVNHDSTAPGCSSFSTSFPL